MRLLRGADSPLDAAGQTDGSDLNFGSIVSDVTSVFTGAPSTTGNETSDPSTPAPAPVTGTVPVVVGTPGAVPFRPGNWDQTHSEYVIAQGDTEVGISALYLGSGARHFEIRALQTHADGEMGPNGPYLNKDTSKWFPGSTAPGSYFREGAVLVMPPEALAKAKELAGNNATPQAATTPGAPGTRPADFAPPKLTATPTSSLVPKKTTLLSGALAVGAGILAYKAFF